MATDRESGVGSLVLTEKAQVRISWAMLILVATGIVSITWLLAGIKADVGLLVDRMARMQRDIDRNSSRIEGLAPWMKPVFPEGK